VGTQFPLEDRGIAPANHLGPSKVEIVPTVIFPGFNVVPFGSNVVFSFSGFIYRNVPAFSLAVGDVISFDLRQANDVETRRTIFFAVANKNPAACVRSTSTGQIQNPQGIMASSGWTQVVSETQIPQNAFGDAVVGNFELRYTAEAPFVFPGGGLLVGFRGSPPATFVDANPDGSITNSLCDDPSGQLYSRFFHLPDQTAGVLDVPDTNTGDGVFIGGMVIFSEGVGTGTCAEGVSEARTRITQLFAGRPILRLTLSILLSRMQQAGFPNAETNFGRLLDFAAQQGIITPQDATDLRALVSPC
jgi:hypothetical protein